MPSFRDADIEAELGRVAYLRILAAGDAWVGALLAIDPRGSPLDLCYAREPGSEGSQRLVPALLAACERMPDLLLALAGEYEPAPESTLPCCLMSAAGAGASPAWRPAAPLPRSKPYRLYQALDRRQLLTEPFARLERVVRTAEPPLPRQVMRWAPGDGADPRSTLRPDLDLMLRRPGPMEWPADFHDYQRQGIAALLARSGLLLADDMGLGKTIQAIAAVRILAHWRIIETALAIVPAGLVPQWRRELRLWAPDLRLMAIGGRPEERAWQWPAEAHLHLVGYETFRADCTADPKSWPRRRRWDAVILDEAQRIKNRETDVSRRAKLLGRGRSWALTGTPLENRLDDTASILDFVDGGQAGAVRRRLAAVQLRRRKSDVLSQLPPKSVTTVALALTGAQRHAYDTAEREGIVELRSAGAGVRIENVLELILRLKQICNFCPRTKRSAKLDDLRERLAALAGQGHRALVFSQFTDARFGVAALADGLRELAPLAYTGAQTTDQRDAVIAAFKASPTHKVLILSLRAGGLGLNLTEADYVFHFDRWWNPATGRQAEDRAHRLGQTSPVMVQSYVLEGTIEERIDQILREKQQLFDDLIEGTPSDLRSILSAAELFGLFGLAPPPSRSRRP